MKCAIISELELEKESMMPEHETTSCEHEHCGHCQAKHGHSHDVHDHHSHHHHHEVSGNILTAFILNLSFSLFEFIGGFLTNSVAIISDAIHDLGDASVIGISWYLERRSKKHSDEKYSYGYRRLSTLGAFITTCVLLFGSGLVIATAAPRLLSPEEVNYDGMLVFAVFGVVVNGIAAWRTSGGNSLNQRAVSLHMLEDVLGWLAVLVGAVLMKFTGWYIIDPLLSIGIAAFIAYNAVSNMKEILPVFLEQVPNDFAVEDVMEEIVSEIDEVCSVHHVHVWCLDESTWIATLHAVVEIGLDERHGQIKQEIKGLLAAHGIAHSTIELDLPDDACDEDCPICPCVHSQDTAA